MAVIVSGWAYVGWRNLPRFGQPQAGVAACSIIACCLACWWIGRRTGRAGAVAVATARAEARAAAAARSVSSSQASNVVNLLVTSDGARQVAADRFALPEWVGPPIVGELAQDTEEMSAEEMYMSAEEQAVQEVAP